MELTGALYSGLEYPWNPGLPGDMDLDLERDVGTQDRVELGGEKPGKNIGVGGKEGVDEAAGASAESEEPARSGQNLLAGSVDLKCSRSSFGKVLKASLAEEEVSEESSKMFLEFKKSAHPGFAIACNAMGFKTPELGGIRSQI